MYCPGFLTRRGWLSLAALGLGQNWPADFRRYLDAATEFPVVRLTDPAYDSRLPAAPARVFGRRSDGLYYASTRDGKWDLFRLEFANGLVRQLTEADALVPSAFTLTPDERWIVYADGERLMASSLGNLRAQEAARLTGGAELRGTPAFTDDGTMLFWLECKDRRTAVRMLRWPKGAAQTVFDLEGDAEEVHPNPRRATLFVCGADGAVTLSAYDGTQRRNLEAQDGRVRQALWSADGRTVCYLLEPARAGQLVTIREYDIDTRADRQVARTTQYARFARNADGSVFLGVSGQQASPMVLLLLRVTSRELSLCEHKSSRPAGACPLFSPNSQRVVFQSDREGKPALYTMTVDKYVEKTD